jgi:hypothetical protein
MKVKTYILLTVLLASQVPTPTPTPHPKHLSSEIPRTQFEIGTEPKLDIFFSPSPTPEKKHGN